MLGGNNVIHNGKCLISSMKQEIISKQSKLSSFNRARKTNKERIFRRLSKRESDL